MRDRDAVHHDTVERWLVALGHNCLAQDASGRGLHADRLGRRHGAGQEPVGTFGQGHRQGGRGGRRQGPGGKQNRLYLNDAGGMFTDATASRMPFDNDDTAAEEDDAESSDTGDESSASVTSNVTFLPTTCFASIPALSETISS